MLLANVLKQLLEGITLAQSMSDKATIRLAEMYLQDDYLRHFHVPHSKVESIDIDLKFALSPNYSLSKSRKTALIKKIILALSSLEESYNLEKKVHGSSLGKDLANIIPQETPFNKGKLIRTITNLVREYFSGYHKIKITEEITRDLNDAIQVLVEESIGYEEKDYILGTVVPTEEIKDFPPEFISTLKLKLGIHNKEWVCDIVEGKEKLKLVSS